MGREDDAGESGSCVGVRKISCPYCGVCVEANDENERDMQECGKTCLCCTGCGKLFVLRDDGDGEFVMA